MARQSRVEKPAGKPRLRLFVVGDEPNSKLARQNLQELFERDLNSLYELEVIDVLQDYQSALDAGILVAPMLILSLPKMRITIAGDLSDTARVFAALQSAVRDKPA